MKRQSFADILVGIEGDFEYFVNFGDIGNHFGISKCIGALNLFAV